MSYATPLSPGEDENDPPERVIGLALASILFLRCLSWSFQVLGGQPIFCLSFGTYDAATSRAATGRTATPGRASAGASATAGAAATVAIVPPVMVAVMVAILVVIFVLVAMVAPAEPGPRMTFVLAGKGGG
jgi:hypothetical protein